MNTITNDIATRLLAQENLLIHRAPVSTASFDVKNRVLTLPQWKNMTIEIEEMLKAHEVGHALYTDEESLADLKDTGVPFGYINILEDARIEKLMKRKYPGLRRVFNIGYRQLNEQDFFSVQKSQRKLLLIDRINLYFKIGYTSAVKFTPAEKYLVEQVERLESMEEVIALAKRIHAFTKQELEEAKQQRQQSQEYKKLQDEIQKEQEEEQMLDDMEELEDEFMDDSYADESDYQDYEDSNESEEYEPAKGYTDQEEEQFGVTPDENHEEEDVPMTDRALENKLRDLADVNTRYVYVTLPKTDVLDKVVIPYKQVLADAKIGVEEARNRAVEDSVAYDNKEFVESFDQRYADRVKQYEDFKAETTRVVNYLIKEFEMKKAATNYKRSQIAKTGVLDVRKLAFYKTREDLFKQIRIEKDGQKHGMIFLLDWSGSMTDVINETAKQLISLVFFCYRAKIPFQVFAFTDRRFLDNYDDYKKCDLALMQPNTLGIYSHFHLIEFFSSKMTQSELQTMARAFYIMTLTGEYSKSEYSLYGTPLNESLIYIYNYAEKFIRDNNVEKFSLIKLTDGEGGDIHRYVDDKSEMTHFSEYNYEIVNDQHVRIKTRMFIQDPTSKKDIAFERGNTTFAICELIKAKYNCSIIGFHVTGKSAGNLTSSLQVYGVPFYDARNLVLDVRRAMNNDLFYSIKAPGHDDVFLMPNTVKVADEQLSESMGEMTANQIAKKFGKYLGAKRTSRILLNRFIQMVA